LAACWNGVVVELAASLKDIKCGSRIGSLLNGMVVELAAGLKDIKV
jgi:hypothetical protein